ncbi:hypothetical protein [Georgenia sp. SUBG003]|uniref:hypothetical protein n=1 Tax=Georgenia sp. SUBG003 TaxID=1497974 RepID=UPI003AB632D9
MELSMMDIFFSEVMGTAMLTLLGCGVVANVILPKTKGFNSGWVVITFGWGLAVFAGVYVAYKSGGRARRAGGQGPERDLVTGRRRRGGPGPGPRSSRHGERRGAHDGGMSGGMSPLPGDECPPRGTISPVAG